MVKISGLFVMKVSFFDKLLIRNYLVNLSVVSLLCSFAFFVIKLPDDMRVTIGIWIIICLFFMYIIMWGKAMFLKSAIFRINGTKFHIKTGDIFTEKGLKVIPFNEYFDTIVDDILISKSSLNGIYLKTKVNDVNVLNINIDKFFSQSHKASGIDYGKKCGNSKRYKLGTIFVNNNYLLTAFSKFDNDYRAYLSMQDYIHFLLNFWNEVDIYYNGSSVVIPLLGSGITRFHQYSMTEQELLEMLLLSFKISKIKFNHLSKITIVIHHSLRNRINLYKNYDVLSS